VTRIEIHNAVAILHTVPSVLGVVRHRVSYQGVRLPPIEAQKLIKRFLLEKGGGSMYSLMEAIWEDADLSSALQALGVGRSDLTMGGLGLIQKRKGGFWDGWMRPVAPDGSFPTGLLGHVQRVLDVYCSAPYSIDDQRGPAPFGDPVGKPIELWGFQQEAVEAFLAAGRGVVDLPPRSGKTRIAISVVCRLGLPTIFIVPSVGLARQTVQAFRAVLPAREVASATGGRPSQARSREMTRAMVVIGTPKSVTYLPDIASRRVMVVDEFHHSAAETWRAVSYAARSAYWRLGLTGTNYRADGHDMEMHGVLDRAVYRQTVGEMVARGRLVPARIALLRIRGSSPGDYRRGVVQHEERNAALAWAARCLLERGKRVLVLTKEVDHAKHLAAMTGGVQVDGEDGDAVEAALDLMRSGKLRCLVGTSVIGEGRDVPVADALVYAAGGRSPVKVKQDYFRALTAYPGKRFGIIIDAADGQSVKLTEQAADRLLLYRSEECFTADVIEQSGFLGWLEAVDR